MTKRSLCSIALVAVVVGISACLATRASIPQKPYANFEPAQTNPIRLSADGTRLYVANTANNSLSVFDVTTPQNPKLLIEIPVGVGPVSVNPRTNDEVWVVNQVSNSVSIVSVSRGIVISTLPAKIEPMDVVFAGSNKAYLSLSRSNQIAVIDTNTLGLVAALPVFGGNPRALAVSNDGSTVYAAFALAGNGTTIIPQAIAPPQPPPTNTQLPAPPKVALIVPASNPSSVPGCTGPCASYVNFKMPANGVVAITTGNTPSVAGYYSSVGTVNLGLAVNPVSGDLFVANTDALNLTSFVPSLKGHWVSNRVTRIQGPPPGTITPYDLNPGINYSMLPNPTALSTALAQPTNIVFDPSGNFMYVASFGTDRVAQVDTNGNVLWFVEVSQPSGSGSNADPKNKRGPRGLALNAAAQTLYSLNRLTSTISVINTSTKSVAIEIPVGNDPTPSDIKQGRGFLFDAKLSGNGTGSCASCHVDADMDHIAWNLGDPGGSMSSIVQNGKTIMFHPMKGPMVTQAIRGLNNLSPFHWRGDKMNFQAFNSAFVDLMGAAAQLSTSDMNLYALYATNVLFLPNPYENLDRTLPTSFNGGNPVNGQTDFLTVTLSEPGNKTCNNCHTSNPGPGSNRVINLGFSQPMKTPQLRNVYQKMLYTRHSAQSIDGFGLDNDGHVSTFQDFFADSHFNKYSPQEVIDIGAFELCFDTGTAPAVGFTQTISVINVNNSGVQSNWSTLQSQAALGNIDLIGRGTIQGLVHGLLYQPATSTYLSDNGISYTQSQLQGFVAAGDIITIMGVYPGTGTP